MPIFKKSKPKDVPLPEPESTVKQLDKRVGLDTYRDFYTLKNYWKTVDRNKKTAAGLLMDNRYSGYWMGSGSSSPKNRPGTAARPSINNNSKANGAVENGDANGGVPQVDSRLPYNFRDLYTLKNYWKTIRRNEKDCAKVLLARYLKAHPENQAKYAKLKNVSNVSPECSDPGFEAVSAQYLKVFDDIITTVEEQPSDASPACDRLVAVGKMHRAKVSGMKFDDFQHLEEPFLYMVGEVLQDRFNEKAENLFRKFFQFCLKYILEGFNS